VEEEPDGEGSGENRSYLPAQAKRPVHDRLVFLSGLKNKLAGATNVFSRLGKTNALIGPAGLCFCFFFLQSVFLQSITV
jgi:hypothetical protein